MNPPEDEYELRPRPSKPVSIEIPSDTLSSIEDVAAGKDMSTQALIRRYIGQGLRADLSQRYGDRVLERAAKVLTRHLGPKEEVPAILRKIQAADS